MTERIGDFVRIGWARGPSDAITTRAMLEAAGFTVITPGFSDGLIMRGRLRNAENIPLLVHRDVADSARHMLEGIAKGEIKPLARPDETPEYDYRGPRGPGFLEWLRGLWR